MRRRFGIAVLLLVAVANGCSSDASTPATRPSFPNLDPPTVPQPSTDVCPRTRPTQTTLTSTGPNDSEVFTPVPLTFELALVPGTACANGSVQLTVDSTNSSTTPVDARLSFILVAADGTFWDLGTTIDVHVEGSATSTAEVTLGVPNYIAPGHYAISVKGATETADIEIAAPT